MKLRKFGANNQISHTPMNHVKKIVASCLLGLALSVTAKNIENILIIDGHFFEEMPVAAAGITGMSRISTPNGTNAMLITLSTPLPEAALKYAVSAEDVPEAEDLLKRAAAAKVMSLSIGQPTETKINVGQKFPEFSAKDINGKIWTNEDVAGKVMVLNLWFTGCGPCRSEMPELSQWKNEMPDVMFFSATYEDAETAQPVIEKQGFNWIALVNDTQFKEWIDSNGYPLTIVVDKSGAIAHIEHGTSPVQRETIKAKIRSIR